VLCNWGVIPTISEDIVAKKRPGRLPLLFSKGLPDFLQFLGPIFRFLPDFLGNKNGGFGLGGQDNAIARAGVDLDDLGVNFVLGLEDDPGKIGVAAKRVDDDALDADIEGVENKADQFVGQRPLIVFAAHGHRDGAADAGLNVNDKAFLFVTDENGQGVLVRGENSKDFHADNIGVHK